MEVTRWSPEAPLSAVTAGSTGAQLLDLFDAHGSFFEVEITALDEPAFAFGDTPLDELEPHRTTNLETMTKKKSTFQRQKEELAYLHSQLAELEAQVRVLRGTDRLRDDESMDNSAADSDRQTQQSASALSLWHVLAKHQLSNRNRAEQDNAELRKILSEQTQLARSLEWMVRRRSALLKSHRKTIQRQVVDTRGRDAEIFQVLFNKLKQRMSSVDDVFEAYGLTPATADMNVTNVIPNDSQSVRVEFTNARLLAFDFRALSSTIWKHLREKELKIEGAKLNIQVIQHTEELLVTKQALPVNSSTTSSSGSTTVFSMFKRVVQETRVLLVWECLIERNGSAERGSLPAFYLSQYGCAQTVRVHDKSLDGRPLASLIQSHGRLVVPIQMETACNYARD